MVIVALQKAFPGCSKPMRPCKAQCFAVFYQCLSAKCISFPPNAFLARSSSMLPCKKQCFAAAYQCCFVDHQLAIAGFHCSGAASCSLLIYRVFRFFSIVGLLFLHATPGQLIEGAQKQGQKYSVSSGYGLPLKLFIYFIPS